MDYYAHDINKISAAINKAIENEKEHIKFLKLLYPVISKYHGKVINCKFGEIKVDGYERIYYSKRYERPCLGTYVRNNNYPIEFNLAEKSNDRIVRFDIAKLTKEIDDHEKRLKDMIAKSENYIEIVGQCNVLVECTRKAFDRLRDLPGYYNYYHRYN